MITLSSEKELLDSVFNDKGLEGLVHFYDIRHIDSRPLGAAAALSYAMEKADIMIESRGKSILIGKTEEGFQVFAWIPEYKGFAKFTLQRDGFSTPVRMSLKVVAAHLVDAVDYLVELEDYQASDPIAFCLFKKALVDAYPGLRQHFANFAR